MALAVYLLFSSACFFAVHEHLYITGFLKALLSDDLRGMNDDMNEVSGEMLSSFDTGKKPSAKARPERGEGCRFLPDSMKSRMTGCRI